MSKVKTGSVILFSLILCEIILRIFMPELRYYYFAKGVTGGIKFTRNRFGTRDGEFDEKVPEGEYRIFCAGDSTTFGMSEKLQDTWPKQLEKKARNFNDKISVINGAGAGRHLHIQLQLLNEDYADIDMDIYILGFCMNDVVIKTDKLDQEKVIQGTERTSWQRVKGSIRRIRYSINRFYLFSFLQYLMKKFDKTANSSEYILKSWPYAFNAFGITADHGKAWDDTLSSLEEINDILKRRGIVFVIVPIPYRFMISDDIRDNRLGFIKKTFRIDPIDKLRSFCQKNNIVFVESVQALRKKRKLMIEGLITYNHMYIDITGDICHPNAYGYKIIAEAVFDRLDQEQIW